MFTRLYSHNVCDKVDTKLSDQPHFCNKQTKIINTAKDFRKPHISVHDSVPCANGFLGRIFGLEY